MDEKKFWELVDWSKAEAADSEDDQSILLAEKLTTLPVQEVVDFERIFDAMMAKAYRWDLWAVAFIINGGCSDDSFMDFRAWIISRGQQFFENSMKAPESIGNAVQPGEETFYEDFLGMTFDILPDGVGLEKSAEPGEPMGPAWNEDQLPSLYPGLCEKFGYEG